MDRRILISVYTLALALLMQFGGIVWWASSQSEGLKATQASICELGSRVKAIEDKMARVDLMESRITRVESVQEDFQPMQFEFVRALERLDALVIELKEIKLRLRGVETG